MSVTDRHGMTFVVKVALNPNTTNQPTSAGTKVKVICQGQDQI